MSVPIRSILPDVDRASFKLIKAKYSTITYYVFVLRRKKERPTDKSILSFVHRLDKIPYAKVRILFNKEPFFKEYSVDYYYFCAFCVTIIII